MLMKVCALIFFVACFSFAQAQEIYFLTGEVNFPLLNNYSAYGLDHALAEKIRASYEQDFKEAKRKNELDYELRLFALVSEKQLLYSPYVLIRNAEEKNLIVYMDSASYALTMVWNYENEELIKNQQFLLFEGKGTWLGENAYWLTEFGQLTLKEDKSRSLVSPKLAMDVYRK
ncbi:hypothetical protein D3C87_200370 [compost metagenome]